MPLLFRHPDGRLEGMGTAFHVDGWGTPLTADHVIADMRRHLPATREAGSSVLTFTQKGVDEPLLFALLGFGVFYGNSAPIPDDAWALVRNAFTLDGTRDDPVAIFQGRLKDTFDPADLSVLMLLSPPVPEDVQTLPVRMRGRVPRVGETVVAVGFPELPRAQANLDDVERAYTEGMQASYGRVLDVHPKGRGRNFPVFVVDAEWPHGMSEGPVFNQNGEVVGLVSTDFDTDQYERFPATSAAVCFEFLSQMPDWLTSMDAENPGWRRGWAVRDRETGVLVAISKDRDDAVVRAEAVEGGEVVRCANRIGTSDAIVL